MSQRNVILDCPGPADILRSLLQDFKNLKLKVTSLALKNKPERESGWSWRCGKENRRKVVRINQTKARGLVTRMERSDK